jgi:hypothetical protein
METVEFHLRTKLKKIKIHNLLLNKLAKKYKNKLLKIYLKKVFSIFKTIKIKRKY